MRDIAFRGKRKDNGEWVYGAYFQGNIVERILIDINRPIMYDIDPKTVGQYTGLNDKNGKQIYEGDIVKCVSELYTNFGETPTGRYATDFYEILVKTDDSYCFGSRKIGRKIGKDYISTPVLKICAEKYYEVIGNIYNNPELLEVGK